MAKLLASFFLALALSWSAASAQCPVRNTSQVVLYKNAWVGVSGNPAPSWAAWDAAYSAQTFAMPFDALNAGGGRVCNAILTAVWWPNSASAYTGVGMFICPALTNAPSVNLMGTCVWSAYFAGNNAQWASYTPGCASLVGGPGPRPCRADVTAVLNYMIAMGQPYYLTIGTFGNGANGPVVFDVELAISWQ